MTTNWKQTETANGAGAEAPRVFARARGVPGRRHVRALRWKQDAVCRENAPAAADLRDAEPGVSSGLPADSASSSLTRTIFFTSRIQTQTQTRKETQNTNQKKKGKQTKQVTISQEPRNLSLTTKEKKLWQD